MNKPDLTYIDPNGRSNWIPQRTLLRVRWIAIMGQLVALNVAAYIYNIQLPIQYCLSVVLASAMTNFIFYFIYPENKRLTERETSFLLILDLFQLFLLLMLTGGLNNPFALLVLAPVTIAATALPSRLTILIGAVAVVLISLLELIHFPLITVGGQVLEIPNVFRFGFWLAIVVGVIFIALYTRRITGELTSMSEALWATQMALSREQKLTDLGGVVAATAHELGTPLATIKLVSRELMEELKDNPDLYEDADLIREQADRCRDILQSMGRAGKDDLHLRHAPLSAVVKEAAEPHLERGKTVMFHNDPKAQTPHPDIHRQPEIIHGLRNLIQNAVDFADTAITVVMFWDETSIRLRIIDDGRGFAPHVITRVGEPFVRSRPAQKSGARPGYSGMGLGLFIAKTLLERSGATLSFSNGNAALTKGISHKMGAIVEVEWDRAGIEYSGQIAGENPPIS